MANQFCLVSYTICYAELIDHKIKIDSLTNFRDIVNFVDSPCNLMTKYGHESGLNYHFSFKSWD